MTSWIRFKVPNEDFLYISFTLKSRTHIIVLAVLLLKLLTVIGVNVKMYQR